LFFKFIKLFCILELQEIRSNERQRLWIHFAQSYQAHNSKVLLKMEEPEGIGAQTYRALSDLHRAGPEPAGMERYDFQGGRLSRLVREAILGKKITLSRGAEILGLKINVMRDIVGSWAN
jgi:hypothetical protein